MQILSYFISIVHNDRPSLIIACDASQVPSGREKLHVPRIGDSHRHRNVPHVRNTSLINRKTHLPRSSTVVDIATCYLSICRTENLANYKALKISAKDQVRIVEFSSLKRDPVPDK